MTAMTENPMFCVQEQIRTVGLVPDYADDTVWIDMESGR